MDLAKGIRLNDYNIFYSNGHFNVNRGWCNWVVFQDLTYMTITGSKETIDDDVLGFIKIYVEENIGY